MMRFLEQHQGLSALAAVITAVGTLFTATAQVVAKPGTKVVVIQNERPAVPDPAGEDFSEAGEGGVPPPLMKKLLTLDHEAAIKLQKSYEAWNWEPAEQT